MSAVLVALTNLLAGLWKNPPVLGVLVLNLIPAFCVLFFGWSALVLLLLYWAENVVIGVVNVLKMGVTSVAGGAFGVLAGLMSIPFFILHYGGFCAGHGLFVVAVAGGGMQGGDPLEAAKMVWADKWDYAVPVAAMVIYYLGDFVRWLRDGEWRGVDVGTQMGDPYGRIIVLHISILFGAGFVVALGQPAAAVALLAILKTFYETHTTVKRQQKLKAKMMGGAGEQARSRQR